MLFILLIPDLIIDTLVNNSSILAGVVNNDNKVIQSTTSTIEISNMNLEDVSKIITTSYFSTQPINNFVKILPIDFENVLSKKIEKETNLKVVNLWQK